MASESKASDGARDGGAAATVAASADAGAPSPILALITGEKHERGYPSAIFIVRGRAGGGRARGAWPGGRSGAASGGTNRRPCVGQCMRG